MKWIGISGSWRKTNKKVEKDVRRTVREIMSRGDGIVSGGALNVDYIATNEVLKLDRTAKKIKVFLPTTLEIYAKHYRKRAKEGVITEKQAGDLITQLAKLKKINPRALIENKKNRIVDEKTYHERNSKVVKEADELIAFYINKSSGVGDTIEKARKKGIPVKIFTYTSKIIFFERNK